MTTYAYDSSTTHLLAVWGAGVGSAAHSVARLHARTPVAVGRRLAHGLTQLSTTAWLSYEESDIAGPVPVSPALRAIVDPNVVRAGRLRVDPDWVVEAGHDVGRTLREAGSAGVRRAVVADVEAEFDAIERALLGDLAGRAGQAVMMSRLDASPVQIAAADRLLHEVPTGGQPLTTDVEPTAACVAAAHWLRAAVDVTRDAIGGDDDGDVLATEEAAQPWDVVAPRLVLARMDDGLSPLAAVLSLVLSAKRVARGFVPAPDECDVRGHVVLDPGRPSRQLLDQLMLALRTCGQLHLEVCGPGAPDPFDAFDAAVRAEAGRASDRLLAPVR
ncbi:hypothetical protein I4I73_11715 [Pseudonocardia sp. KRD-184]|uniref:Myo-inositol-1-phosphate synthase n=1 Tax=Pseudonocardia oceani TaxID=2792013 RepID=A0ABS6UEP0_9PSEU|nr:hypothetical protein [Pseudonocardia oceani]MBW0089610.1 hypothetical protein [Pseudonocardia oceani]MBW0096653.1 hypothetical protein [Pseudonocardia oceani]MBW0109355.1 hypothetical protein [Pseudonocardia oceani]MBW0123431.1 hypothetical protein [Pseudonocardia oceani]MBW0130704.1 hypothetical protein [Pseudonocardia oceani]